MKVLIAHNRYRQRGGEDAVVDDELQLLRSLGVQAELHERHNDDVNEHTLSGQLAAAREALWSRRSFDELRARIQAWRPDLIHVHNTVHRLSPSIFDAALAERVPVVQTLHNFRLACAQGGFLREGRACEDCLGRAPWPAIAHGCYRGSRAQTAVLLLSQRKQRQRGAWWRVVRRFIALNTWCRDKLVQAGLPAERLRVHGNWLGEWGGDGDAAGFARQGVLYVGRLSREKGIATLAQAVREGGAAMPPLTVIGAGDEAARLHGLPGVRLLGALPHAQVLEQMRRHAALVLPSECVESMPRVLVEAMAQALPVLASRIGPLPELLGGGAAGTLFTPGNASELAACLQDVAARPAHWRALGAAGRCLFEQQHTAQRGGERLLAIYAEVLSERSPLASDG